MSKVQGASSILGLGAKLNRMKQETEDQRQQWANVELSQQI